jgi:hypothetical protein
MNDIPIVTYVACVIVVIAALVGGAVVIWGDPGALSYGDYLKDMAGFTVGLGLVGVGRGIAQHGAVGTGRAAKKGGHV